MHRLPCVALARGGFGGLGDLFSQPSGEHAFFGMAKEAQMLAAVRALAPVDVTVFWRTNGFLSA